MSGIKRSQAIKAYLDANTWPDLAAMYNSGMETQVNVAQDGGRRVDREYKGRNWFEFTDDVQTWKAFRIPLNSMTEPEDNDNEIKFDLSLHVEGIGMTGWNWAQRRSLWVAYDFDTVMGHSERHTKKLTPNELDEIKKKVAEIEWVTLRRSTGGAGLHIYVMLDFDEKINNHNEHMAVGKAVLSQLSAIAGFDFESKVDVNAGNMWVWHRKMMRPDGTRNNGLELLKAGSKLKQVPSNWKDYIDVVTGKRRRTMPFFIKALDEPEKEYDLFEELSNQRPKIPLDKDHKRLIEWIAEHTPGGSWWHEDHWMLVTHTYTLKLAHDALKLKGPFETLASGSQHGGDHNIFMYPLPHGAWTVRRYTRGCSEASTWMQDGQGWTYCLFNRSPDFKMACKLNGGIEKANGGWAFKEAKQALAAALMLGSQLTLPEKFHYRPTVLKQHKDKRLIIEIEKSPSDEGVIEFDGSGKSWSRIFDAKVEPTQTNVEALNLDQVVRHIVNVGGRDEGWVVNSGGTWRDEPLEHVKLVLRGHFGYKPNEAEQILGTGAIQPYILVNRPFDVEYPPGRLWNRNAAKLRYEPSQNIDNLKFDTWLRILEHLGEELTPYIHINPWARANNVVSGADYLMLWMASLFQRPEDRLPYLFFYSEKQNTGKSTFHQAIKLLMGGGTEEEGTPPGYMKVDQALRAQATFNAELQNAIVCVIEELDLNPKRSDAKISNNRIKELVTENTISIHAKGKTPCMVKNWTHFIQTSNDKNSCPVFKGDTRITVIKVNPIDDIDIIPPPKLTAMLTNEAPDFLAHILRLEIPPSNDRLALPVIETEDKREVQSANLSVVELFIQEECHHVDGETILWSEFYSKFQAWMEPLDAEKWTMKYTGFRMPELHPRARRKTDNQWAVANLSWQTRDPLKPVMSRLVVKGDRLVPLNSTNGKNSNGRQNSSDTKTAGSESESPTKDSTST